MEINETKSTTGEETPKPVKKEAAPDGLTVAVAGLGLIGGSLAQRLAEAGVRTLAWNHHDTPYAKAREAGIGCLPSLADLAAAQPDVLILCTPLKAMGDALAAIAPILAEKTTVSDVGSVKAQVRDAVRAAGLDTQYVGAHPMAGSEFSGYGASSAGLLDGALWALTFDGDTDFARFSQMVRLVTGPLGNTCIGLDDATHDQAAALISHMPHVVATALANAITASPDREVAAALSAGSWRDMTRVALTDPERTRAMVEENPANVARLTRDVATRLEHMADLLDDPERNAEQIGEFFAFADPYRRFKKAQREHLPLEEGTLELSGGGSGDWRGALIASARRGERITGVLSDTCLATVRQSVPGEGR